MMLLDFNGLKVKATYSHTESHWKGKINVYDVEVGENINFRFLDNFNRKKYRDDLITKGILSYIVDENKRKVFVSYGVAQPYGTMSSNKYGSNFNNLLSKDWVDSVEVFLKIQ